MLQLPDEGLFVLKRLEERGFEAWFVGGLVRDWLSGRASNDADIATNALPQQVQQAFSDCDVIDTGVRHGTVTVLVNHVPVEVTTYRTESGYSDARHPDKVAFTRRLEDDLSRRDFTVNAMAYHPQRGLIDLFGGKTDLRQGIIRCVGNSRARFEEDALRVLRALRFASTLSFSLSDETAEAALALKETIRMLSKERVFSEITKMLCGKNIRNVLLEYSAILAVVFPFLTDMDGFNQHNAHHCFDLLEHTAAVVEAIAPKPHLRLAALLHDCAKPYCFTLDQNGVGHFYGHAALGEKKAAALLRELKADNFTCARVPLLVKWHDTPLEADERLLKRRLRQLGEDALRDLLLLQRADTMGLAPAYHGRMTQLDEIETILDEILAADACFSVKKLAVDGNDLKTLGLHGREIGKTLSFLVDAVIDEQVENKKEALLCYLQNRGQKQFSRNDPQGNPSP